MDCGTTSELSKWCVIVKDCGGLDALLTVLFNTSQEKCAGIVGGTLKVVQSAAQATVVRRPLSYVEV